MAAADAAGIHTQARPSPSPRADPMPTERSGHKRPFAAWVKRLTNLHPSSKKAKNLKALQLKNKNNPYPQSGHLRESTTSSDNDNASLSVHHTPDDRSRRSSISAPPVNSNRSQANTVATNNETIHSDGGYFKSHNGRGGALSSVDGAGPNSTFSSPNQSQQSLTTTLTTIQSTNAHLTPNPPHAHFFAQPPSALPPHLVPNTNSNNPHNDNASILTLASSSKRRRRSMDTDASVRAIPPRSMWGDSRESLPLSVLSANIDHVSARPSVGGLVSAERASVYSAQGVSAPALASDRNSYYAASHRHVTKDKDRDKDGHRDRDFGADGRSINFDAKSLNFDGRSLGGDVGSLRGYEGSMRSGALGHGRNDSIPSGSSPLVGSSLLRRPSGALTSSSDIRDKEEHESADHKNFS